jgi:hypothetical protein
MLEGRLALPNAARSPHVGDVRRLGERAFHAAARTMHGTMRGVELERLLARPRRLQHLVSFWREA